MRVSLSYPRILAAVLFLSTLLGAGYAASTSTASFGSYNPNWDGSQGLRVLADTHTETTIAETTTPYTTHGENTTSFILSPHDDYTPRQVDRIRGFLARGGTLVVASDFQPYANHLLSRLGVASRIDGRLVRDEHNYYRGPALPIASRVTAPLNETVHQLTLNHASMIQADPNATLLVSTSGYAYVDANRNGELDDTETLDSYPVVVSEAVGPGRVVVVSDPSVFINAMLDRPDNRRFARALFSERVLLDYSHTSSVPVLAHVLLLVRDSRFFQLVLSVLVLGVGWGLVRGLPISLRESSEASSVSLSFEERCALVRDEHPEWDAERVERVARSIRSSTEPTGND